MTFTTIKRIIFLKPRNKAKQGSETGPGQRDGPGQKGTRLYSEFLNWDLSNEESALRRSKWRIFWLLLWQIPQGENKLLYSRTEGRPAWLDYSEGRGGDAVLLACMILQVLARVFWISSFVHWEPLESVKQGSKVIWYIFLKGYSSCWEKQSIGGGNRGVWSIGKRLLLWAKWVITPQSYSELMAGPGGKRLDLLQ